MRVAHERQPSPSAIVTVKGGCREGGNQAGQADKAMSRIHTFGLMAVLTATRSCTGDGYLRLDCAGGATTAGVQALVLLPAPWLAQLVSAFEQRLRVTTGNGRNPLCHAPHYGEV